MKYFVALALSVFFFSTAVSGQVTTFTNSADFHSAVPASTLIEDFEDSDPAVRDITLASYTGPGGEIVFTPVTSYPFPANLVLASPGVHAFPLDVDPTASIVLSVTGNEDFIGTLTSPTQALGFDLYLNDYPGTLSFFNGTTLLATLTFEDPPLMGNNLAFAGITSVEGVTSFQWTATNGQYVNTAIDNVFIGNLAVPEPSTWAMMLFGFAGVGVALRRQRRPFSTRTA